MDFSRIVHILGRRWLLVLAVFCLTAAGQIVYLLLQTTSVTVEAAVEVLPPTMSDQVVALQMPRTLQTNVMSLKQRAKTAECIDAVLECVPVEERNAARTTLALLEVVPDLAKNSARVMLTASTEPEGVALLKHTLAVFATQVGREVSSEVETLAARIAQQFQAVSADLDAAEEALGRLRGASPSEGALFGWDEETTAARTRLQLAETRLDELKSKEMALLRGIKDLEVMPPPQQLRTILGDSLLAEMIERQFKEILDKYVELLRRQIHLTDRHPDIKKLKDDIASAETVFESFTEPSGELYPLVASVYKTAKDKLALEIEGRRGELAALRAALEERTAHLAAAKNSLELLQRNRAEYIRSFQQVSALKSRRDKLAQVGEELKLLSQNAPTRVRIVVPPAVPRTKGLPLGVTLWLSLVLAALLSGAACYGAEALDPRIHDAAQIRACSKVPILGVVPRVGAAFLEAPGDGLEETFALIARKLRQCAPAPASVVVCSATAGAGTTFVVDGLARIAASFGARVLVVECARSARTKSRVRTHTTREGLGTLLSGSYARRRALCVAAGSARTFSDFLVLAKDADDFPTLATPWPLVHRLPYGDGPLANANLEAKAARLLASAKRRYDLVLVDCPPVTAAPHATLLGGVADGVVLVMRAQETKINVFADTLKRWEGTGLTLFGVVLNGVRAGAAAPSVAPPLERSCA